MKTKLTFLFGYGLLIFSGTGLQAQNGPVSAGGEAFGNGIGIIDYSIGQVNYNSSVSSDGIINEGLQQLYEIFAVTDIKKEVNDPKILLYPNPTLNFITIDLQQEIVTQNATCTIENLQGKLISRQEIIDKKTSISMQEFPVGVYLVRVYLSNTFLKTFKIIKNQ